MALIYGFAPWDAAAVTSAHDAIHAIRFLTPGEAAMRAAIDRCKALGFVLAAGGFDVPRGDVGAELSCARRIRNHAGMGV
jgi:hypothetical protein